MLNDIDKKILIALIAAAATVLAALLMSSWGSAWLFALMAPPA